MTIGIWQWANFPKCWTVPLILIKHYSPSFCLVKKTLEQHLDDGPASSCRELQSGPIVFWNQFLLACLEDSWGFILPKLYLSPPGPQTVSRELPQEWVMNALSRCWNWPTSIAQELILTPSRGTHDWQSAHSWQVKHEWDASSTKDQLFSWR